MGSDRTRPVTAADKRQFVLDAMERGMSFDAAYTAAGLSDYGANRANYLKRLIDNGHLKVSVAPR